MRPPPVGATPTYRLRGLEAVQLLLPSGFARRLQVICVPCGSQLWHAQTFASVFEMSPALVLSMRAGEQKRGLGVGKL